MIRVKLSTAMYLMSFQLIPISVTKELVTINTDIARASRFSISISKENKMATVYKIHPSIGIARVGDSDVYFVGPDRKSVV